MKHFGLLDDNGEFIPDGNEAFRVQLYKEFIQHRKNHEDFDAELFSFSDAPFSALNYQRDNPISWHHNASRDKALRVYFRLLFTHHDLWEMAHSESDKKTYRHECENLRDEIHSLFEKQSELQEKEKEKTMKKSAPQNVPELQPCPVCGSSNKPFIKTSRTPCAITAKAKTGGDTRCTARTKITCRDCGHEVYEYADSSDNEAAARSKIMAVKKWNRQKDFRILIRNADCDIWAFEYQLNLVNTLHGNKKERLHNMLAKRNNIIRFYNIHSPR